MLWTAVGTLATTAAMKVCDALLTLVSWVTTKPSWPAASTRGLAEMRSLTVLLAFVVNVLDRLSRLTASVSERTGWALTVVTPLFKAVTMASESVVS